MALTGLPLFPLDLVLFPDEGIPLHIFEPKYREMIAYCEQEKAPFGIVRYHDGRLEDIGCTARIRDIIEAHEDGRRDILVVGEERFRIAGIDRSRAYQTAEIELVTDVPAAARAAVGRERLIAQHIKLLELAGRTPSPSAYEDRERLSYFIGRNAGLSLDQRQLLLEMRDEAQRIHFLVAHLETFIPAVEQAEHMRRKISSNGHFPDFPPPIAGSNPAQ